MAAMLWILAIICWLLAGAGAYRLGKRLWGPPPDPYMGTMLLLLGPIGFFVIILAQIMGE